MAKGTKSDPWELTTPPGSSAYTMYRDEESDPPALVCVVGSTTLKYHLSAIDDLHAWLRAKGFTVHQTPTSEFLKAGGSTKCMTLRLDEV